MSATGRHRTDRPNLGHITPRTDIGTKIVNAFAPRVTISTPFEHFENQMLQAAFAEYCRGDAEAFHVVHDEYIATRPELLGRLKRLLKSRLYARAYGGR